MSVNLLFVEAESGVGATLRPFLEDEGYLCEQAASAKEALDKARAAEFDVLLVDLRLGKSDGLSVLNELRRAAPRAVGILLAGHESVEAGLQSLQAGADDFLVKPVEIERLKASIGRSMYWRSRFEEHRAELALSKAQLLAEVTERGLEDALNLLKDELIAIAGHDLKGPLTAIRGYAQALKSRVERPDPNFSEIARGLGVIDAQAAGMARLLEDLLDASRVQAGVLELRPVPCTLESCLEAVLARLSQQDQARIIVDRPDRPLTIECDPRRIEQLLANLIGNALKYSPAGQTVGVAMRDTTDCIELDVRDRGIGITKKQLPKLFDRFYRTPQAEASGMPGTGLGLYICRGIAQAHGGRIWAESAGQDLGTTFRVVLPIVPGPVMSV